MSEYIDRDRLIREGWSLQRTYQKDAYTMVLQMKKPENLPTVDAEPVVRCRDCMYNGSCMLQSFVEDNCVTPIDRTIWFCADGRKRGDAE